MGLSFHTRLQNIKVRKLSNCHQNGVKLKWPLLTGKSQLLPIYSNSVRLCRSILEVLRLCIVTIVRPLLCLILVENGQLCPHLMWLVLP